MGALLLESEVVGLGTVDVFLKDGFGLDGFELCLEDVVTCGGAEAVAATAGFGQIVVVVLELVALLSPAVTCQSRWCSQNGIEMW